MKQNKFVKTMIEGWKGMRNANRVPNAVRQSVRFFSKPYDVPALLRQIADERRAERAEREATRDQNFRHAQKAVKI